MLIMLKCELNRIKNGWSARSPELRLTVHGFSQEVARLNLERTARLFFQPFKRQGTLRDEVTAIGIEVSEINKEGLVVALTGGGRA